MLLIRAGSKTKRFSPGGKKYSLHSNWSTKRAATDVAKNIRFRGHLARVVKEVNPLRKISMQPKEIYSVYILIK